mgnify:CR=1 FL=1
MSPSHHHHALFFVTCSLGGKKGGNETHHHFFLCPSSLYDYQVFVILGEKAAMKNMIAAVQRPRFIPQVLVISPDSVMVRSAHSVIIAGIGMY